MFNYAMKSLALIGSHLCTVSSVFSVYFFNLILQGNTEENIFVANTFGFFFEMLLISKLLRQLARRCFMKKFYQIYRKTPAPDSLLKTRDNFS